MSWIPIHLRLSLLAIERRLEATKPVRKKCWMCSRWMIHNMHSQICRVCEKKVKVRK